MTAGTSHGDYQAEHGIAHQVEATVWIAPYDLGVSQQVALKATPTTIAGVYDLTLVLVRLSGEPGNWMNLNKRFVEDIRKQFLTWRTMAGEERERFSQAEPEAAPAPAPA